jgi:predicted nucleic acid-binding protein
MLYFDTSFLAPLIRYEATTVRVEKFLDAAPTGELAISHWTTVEVASLLARDVRMGELTSEGARRAEDQFDSVVTESFVVLLPEVLDFGLAREYLGHHRTGLRAGDALHLAIAHNRRAETIYTLDRALLRAGKVLGLPMSQGI